MLQVPLKHAGLGATHVAHNDGPVDRQSEHVTGDLYLPGPMASWGEPLRLTFSASVCRQLAILVLGRVQPSVRSYVDGSRDPEDVVRSTTQQFADRDLVMPRNLVAAADILRQA